MPRQLRCGLALLVALYRAQAGYPGSQGNQDRVLHELFYETIGVTNQYYVEFGGCGHAYPGSNTRKLREPQLFATGSRWQKNQSAWRGLLMDGSGCPGVKTTSKTGQVVHTEMITPQNVVSLFDKYDVAEEPDYVSIDVDSTDLWLLKALISGRSRYRARVFTIEYNSNFGLEHAITMPDPTLSMTYNFSLPLKKKVYHHRGREDSTREYHEDTCYQGASARAIEMVAQAHGYVIVNVTLGLDLFLVRADVWSQTGKPVPLLKDLHIGRCQNFRMIPEQAVNLLDYRVWVESKKQHAHAKGMPGRTCAARSAAARQLRQMATADSKTKGFCKYCFSALAELPEPAASDCT